MKDYLKPYMTMSKNQEKMKISKTRIKAWAEDMVKLENLNGIDYYRQKRSIGLVHQSLSRGIHASNTIRDSIPGKFLKRMPRLQKRNQGTIGTEPIDYGPVARWDEETQTIIPSGQICTKTK